MITMPGIGAVARDAAPPIRPSRGRREDHIAEAQTTTAHKKRRMIQIGSSPPPFITSLPHSTSHARPYRLVAPSRPADRPDAVEPSATSPKAAKRRRIVVVRKKNPLELRSSSPASPPPSEHVSLTRHSTAPQAPRSRTMSETATETSRRLLQRKPHLDRSDPSSPIGTFGGQMVRCFDRSPGPSRIGSADFASTLNARTVGLHPLNQATRTRARATTRSRPLQETHRSTVPANENALSMPQMLRVDGDEGQASRLLKTSRRSKSGPGRRFIVSDSAALHLPHQRSNRLLTRIISSTLSQTMRAPADRRLGRSRRV